MHVTDDDFNFCVGLECIYVKYDSTWFAWVIHGFLLVKRWLLTGCKTFFYVIIQYRCESHTIQAKAMDTTPRSHEEEPIQDLRESYTIYTQVMDTTPRSHEEEPIQDLCESYTIHTKPSTPPQKPGVRTNTGSMWKLYNSYKAIDTTPRSQEEEPIQDLCESYTIHTKPWTPPPEARSKNQYRIYVKAIQFIQSHGHHPQRPGGWTNTGSMWKLYNSYKAMDTTPRSQEEEPIQDLRESYTIHTKPSTPPPEARSKNQYRIYVKAIQFIQSHGHHPQKPGGRTNTGSTWKLYNSYKAMDTTPRSQEEEPIQDLRESYTIYTQAMDTTPQKPWLRTNTGSTWKLHTSNQSHGHHPQRPWWRTNTGSTCKLYTSNQSHGYHPQKPYRIHMQAIHFKPKPWIPPPEAMMKNQYRIYVKATHFKPKPWIPPPEAMMKNQYRIHMQAILFKPKPWIPPPEAMMKNQYRIYVKATHFKPKPWIPPPEAMIKNQYMINVKAIHFKPKPWTQPPEAMMNQYRNYVKLKS